MTSRPADGLVRARVMRGGLLWGPVTSAALVLGLASWVAATELPDARYRVEEVREGAAIVAVLLPVAAALGLGVGLVAGWVGGRLLVALRSRTHGFALAWLLTMSFLGALVLVVDAFIDLAPGLVVPICFVAAYPVGRTLRRALRPAEGPA